MALTLYYLSGSPYSWRVWLTLEYKGLPYDMRRMSFEAGDFKQASFLALNPRGRVPVITDDGFSLYESGAIVEYLQDKWPDPPVLSPDLRVRAVQRRMIREADQYFGEALEKLVAEILFTEPAGWSEDKIAKAATELRQELRTWESAIAGDFLAGALSAADFTFYPQLALAQRIVRRKPGLLSDDWIGPRIAAWMKRMEALPLVQRTWPPHWKG